MRVIINIDGGSRGNPGPGAAAFVIKDPSGQILSQEGHFMPHCTNNQAEYTALKLALIKAAELGATDLEIISDSLLLVKQYLGEYKIKHPDLAARMQEIRALARPFTIQIRHVLRHLNKEPDALANKAMDLKQSVGFNPIQNFPASAPLSAPQDNTVNGVAVEIVRHETQDPGQQPVLKQPLSPRQNPAAGTKQPATHAPQKAAPSRAKAARPSAAKKKAGPAAQPSLFEDF